MQIHQKFTWWAAGRLNQLTGDTNTHQPHVALLIAFCKLKMLYDARYDQLIHSNTNFIFSDILQLKKQPILSDRAFISVELAKNVNQYFIPKDTQFKAGKNVDNKTVYYQSTQDLVANSAKIDYLKSTVRLKTGQELYSVLATENAASTEWQVNDAWLPFNDVSESYTGIGLQSKLLKSIDKKDSLVIFEFTFDREIESQGDKKIILRHHSY